MSNLSTKNNFLVITRNSENFSITESALSVLHEYEWIGEVEKKSNHEVRITVHERAFDACVDKNYAPISDQIDPDEYVSLSKILIDILQPIRAEISIESTGLPHLPKNKLKAKYQPEIGDSIIFEIDSSGLSNLRPILPNGDIIHPLDYQIIKTAIEECADKSSLFRKFEKLKRKINESAHLKSCVQLSSWIEQKSFRNCKTIAPKLKQLENGNYEFQSIVRIPNDGFVEEIVADSALVDGGSLRTKHDEIVILSADQEDAVKRIATLTQLGKSETFRYLDRPQDILPDSITDDSQFDLELCSTRLLGFELVTRGVYFDRTASSSGIQWVSDHEAHGLFLTLGQKDGQIFGIELQDRNEATELLNKCELELHRSQLENRPVDTVEHNAVRFEPTELRISDLKRISGMRETAGSTKPNSSYEAAIITSLQQSGLPDIVDLKTDVENKLQPLLNEKTTILNHQREAISWLYNSFHSGRTGAMLCDDMGLGKTFTLLAFMRLMAEEMEQIRCLVVCPVILMGNWEKEVKRFFKLKPYELPTLLRGIDGQNLDRLLQSSWLSLINYESLLKNQRVMATIPFDIVVLDESQRIKNPDVATSRICRGLNRKFLITSTGTPVENKMLDLWTQTDAVMGDFHPLGSREEFENLEANSKADDLVISANQPLNVTEFCRSKLKIHSENRLIMHRKKEEVLESLPQKTFNIESIEMTDVQCQLEEIIKKNKAPIFSKLSDLQKLYQHPAFLNEDLMPTSDEDYIEMSPKLKWLIQQVETNWSNGDKTLIFVLHKEMQIRIADLLFKKHGQHVSIINGDTNARGSSQAFEKIDQFAKDRSPALVLSPIAAGAGLNIVCANHVIHFHRWWNPAKENQATDRAYRIGQKKPVTVHYPILISKKDGQKSFDQKLNELIQNKIVIAQDFLKPIFDIEKDIEEVVNSKRESYV
jgi:SNF2 family DNA or RNA helicase